MKTFGNILWAIFVGWWLMLFFGFCGTILCVTILFIPIGLQYFKLARLALWPFGYEPTFTKLTGFKMFLNILWAIFFGWESALSCYIIGGILCVTILFIPCGLQMFKFGRLVFLPLGTTIEKMQ
ncbi:MAG TPA: YccF domain-containing protein [Bacilli bacterium]|nr:YccF domain-containing protein [Bacilli bacterium]HPS18727.1 YccF domain-containing protein [Bacilli bacterium]